MEDAAWKEHKRTAKRDKEKKKLMLVERRRCLVELEGRHVEEARGMAEEIHQIEEEVGDSPT